MRHFFIFSTFLLAAFMPLAVAQTDGWTSTCPPTYPSVSEVMIDACGDEFRSEYVVLRTNSASFDVRNFGLSVSNPFNSAFIGSVAVTNNAANADALQALNTSAGAACGYGTVFRNAFSAPYNGLIPPNSTVLVFNNRDSTDVTYLSPDALSRLCGSKVFVVFGTLTAQSRGVSIFRNYPQNGSCGTTGCLRKIDFAFNGQTCTQFTYDIKKLPNLNTSNPPVGFNEGSYITPNANGTLTYGGGNLTGAGVTCMPTARLACVVPSVPNYGNGFWNVLAFDGQNTYNTTDFKGFYTADDHDPTTIPADTINGSFEFNTAFDGWKPNSAPSEAVAADGARTTYNGCNVRADSFSVLAKRAGFPCGFYKISLKNYDDNARIRLDADGNGVFEFDQSYAAPSCSAGCGPLIWQGDLGTRSRMEIYGSENRGSFNLHLVFQKDTVGHPSLKINILGTTAVACGGAPTGSISTSITGGLAPYAMTWRGPTAIPMDVLMPTGLPSGVFHATATDVLGCVDSAQILVPQTNAITVQAFGDATFCPNSTAILRGVILGGTPPVTTNWMTSTSETILSISPNYSPIVSKSTTYVLRATDASGCVKADTVDIKTYNVQKIRVTVTPNDTICNDETTVFTARGANNYTWTSFPQIGTAALNPQNATATLYALFLPAPVYTFYAAGQDANGCRDTGSVKVWINPLPAVTITPVADTLCNDAAPYTLVGTPATGGRFYSRTCGNCVQNGLFYPNLAGVGAHEVQHEFIDANGCRNAPSILIKVKNCRCLSSVTTPLSRSICQGDSIKIKNTFYKNAGLFRDTFIKVDGCDSIVILTLTLKNKDTTRLNVKICTPSVKNIDTVFLRNINGCDSMVITTKTLVRRDSTPLRYVLCNGDSVRVNGTWLKQTGETRIRLTNTEGCDSTLIVNILLNRRDTIRLSATTCNRLNVGVDTIKLRNILGCDSLIITTRRLVLSDTVRLSTTTCNRLNVGVDSIKLRNALGCDSLIITTRRLVLSDTVRLSTTTCNRLNVGVDTVKLRNVLGCDSLIITTRRLVLGDTIRLSSTTCNPARVGFDTLKLRNALGCDSLIVTNTRLAAADTTYRFGATCNALDSGVRTLRLVSSLGCDSIVITRTRWNKPDTIRSFSTTCNPIDSGTMTRRLINQFGCDSVIILKTTLSRRDTTPLNPKICRNDSLRFGTQWLKTAGIFTRILRNTEGCDSTIILTLTVQDSNLIRRNATSCDPLRVGTDTLKLKNRLGCDSTIITTTRFANADTTRIEQTTCSVILIGSTTTRFTNRLGCDSIVITTFKLGKSDTTRLVSTTCNPSDSGTTTRRLQGQLGCDSIVILKTTLLRRDSIRLTQTICRNDSFRFGTQWLKTAGVFSRILQNTEGCDSTLILTLQVLKSDTTIVLKTTCNPNSLGDRPRILRNSRGCDSVIITQTRLVPSPMRLTLTVSESISCNGGGNGSVRISTTQNVAPQYQAAWNNGGRGPQIDSLRAGTYTVIVTDSTGCEARDSIRLTEPPPIVVKATGIAPRCYNESLGGFKIDSIQGGTAPYALIFRSMRSVVSTLPLKVDSVRLGFPMFQIVDNKGCTVQTTVEIPEAPDRSLELGSNRTILLGDSTLLTGFMNFKPKNLQWTWTPKDSTIRCSTCLPTYVKPTESTTYKLIALDSAGCAIDDNITIVVNKPRRVFIPTTFSPNNDLMNDRFTIFGDKSVRRVQSFKIFNRWGNPIFDQSDVPLNDELSGWDGSVRGVAMPPDVYVYVVVVEFMDGKIVLYKGEVTLIR